MGEIVHAEREQGQSNWHHGKRVIFQEF